MGSSGSKDASASSSSATTTATASSALVKIRRSRSMPTRVFQSSCLGGSGGDASHDPDDNYHLHSGSDTNHKEETRSLSHDHQTATTDEEEEEEEKETTRKLKQQTCGDAKVNTRSSSQYDVSSRSTRLRSRFSSLAGNLSFRLSRAASFGSSSSRPACPLFSNNVRMNDAEQPPPVPSVTRNQRLLPAAASVRRSRAPHCIDVASPELDPLSLCPGTSSGHSSHLENNPKIVSNQDNQGPVVINNENTTSLPDADHLTSREENTDMEFNQSRRSNRRLGTIEPVERSVRFSRTLSVGRLRDRVFRRSSFTDGLFNSFQRDREVENHPSGDHRRQVLDGISDSDGNADLSPVASTHHRSTMSNAMYNSHDDELETSRPREARYHDIMEHRTDFLERRRRIRSQVRALQRLGSRFENLSGHERSCILTGQHRSGRCTCRLNNRTRNPDDDTNARASISRIVMLAEALFEVLDEIHQQSVVLSSHPSVSSLGSVPAPKEVVESMPVKIYTKLHKHQLEDVAQCYICLVEYEEGDGMRILPCHHEFHTTCVDKWLKEVHRVCPLCRGDVCRSETLPSAN